jgi:hypothetical protein
MAQENQLDLRDSCWRDPWEMREEKRSSSYSDVTLFSPEKTSKETFNVVKSQQLARELLKDEQGMLGVLYRRARHGDCIFAGPRGRREGEGYEITIKTHRYCSDERVTNGRLSKTMIVLTERSLTG